MKRLGQWTIRLVVSGILLLGTLPAWGQGGNPPASTKESGATSGRGVTAVEQTYRGRTSEEWFVIVMTDPQPSNMTTASTMHYAACRS